LIIIKYIKKQYRRGILELSKHAGRLADSYSRLMKYLETAKDQKRAEEKLKKLPSKAVLTTEEDKAWNKAFEFYINQGYSDLKADERAWKDLQIEFPRLKKYEGIER
jgi:hypothetical protein